VTDGANRRAGVLELPAGRDMRVLDSVVRANGRDGLPYNGDGIQLGGTGCGGRAYDAAPLTG
jgi:hypothetical protein